MTMRHHRVLAAGTTVCSAWRWVLVARGVGVELSGRSAVASCYRSQFLNLTLPGGVLGDVHRGVRLGREAGDPGRGLRSVVWEHSAGQAVQALLVVVVVTLLPSTVRPAVLLVLLLVVAVRLLPLAQGVGVAVVYGVMVLVASLPGAALQPAPRFTRRRAIDA